LRERERDRDSAEGEVDDETYRRGAIEEEEEEDPKEPSIIKRRKKRKCKAAFSGEAPTNAMKCQED